MRRSLAFALAAAISVALTAAAQSQSFPIPGKPIRIIVPFAAGGQTDIQARAIAQRMGETLERPGDRREQARRLHADRRARGAEGSARRHTLLYTIATHVQMPHLYKTPPWNVFTDFTPVTDGRALRDRADRAYLGAVQHRAGACRLRQGQSRQAQLRLVRRRIDLASQRRDAAHDGRHRSRPRALQGQRRRHEGSSVRRRAAVLRRADHGDREPRPGA